MSKKKKKKKTTRPNVKSRLDSKETGSRSLANNGVTISACMMVKNEEEFLPRCLESIKGLVDEVIVVDTGSTDNTIEIAEKCGAKVYHHPWENSFSKHRNQSISYANGDWIFVLDGDEEVIQWDHKIDATFLNRDNDSVYVRVENIYGKGEGEAWHNSVRLFRNNEKIFYRGRVHNELVGYEQIAPSAVVIYHRGYCLDPGKEEAKYCRTKALLEREIEKDPNNPKYQHYLAVAYLGKRLYDRALQNCKKALYLASKQDPDGVLYLWTRFVGAVCCFNTNRLEEAERLCLEAVKSNPMHIDSHYLLSTFYYSQGEMQHFLDYSDRYLSLIRKLRNNFADFGSMVHNTIRHEWRIRLHRGFALTVLQKKDKADKEYLLSFKSCHDKGEYHKQRCLFHLNRSEHEAAEKFFHKALKYNPKDGELEKVWSRLLDKGRGKGHGNLTHTNTRRQTDKPTISLCMIVKNEEKFLPKCLDSVKHCVDEIIIVDTGSTDATVEIAEKYTDKVYYHPWEGDFSRHRNQSLNYATKEWIFILDADEVLLPECGETIHEAIKNESIDSVQVIVKSCFDKGSGEAVHNSIRIFRNNHIIHYEGRIHNRLVGEKASKIYPITILHEGYNLSTEESRKKFIRTTTLLKKEIEENPKHPRAYHYLAASYLSESMYKEAIEMAMKAIKLAEENNFDDYLYLWSHFIAGLSFLKTQDLNHAIQICLDAIDKNIKHLDSHYLLSIIYYHRRDWDRLFHHSDEYFSLLQEIQVTPGEFGTMVHNTVNHKWRVHFHRGLALSEMAKGDESEQELTSALELCDDKAEYYKLLTLFHMDASNLSKAESSLLEALNYNPDNAELYGVGARIYGKLGLVAKEKNFLEKALKRGSDNLEYYFRLGTICLEEKRYGEASRLLERVIEKDERHSGALINLGIVARRSGDLDVALRYLERAVREVPKSVEALSNLGYVYYDNDNLLKAKGVFQHLTEIAPMLLDIHLMLCMIYIRLEDIERVVTRCDKILDLLALKRHMTLNSLSDLGNLFADIGKALFERKQPAMGALAFDVFVYLSGETSETLKRVARMCFEQGFYNASLEYLEKAVPLNPKDWESFSLMGDCYAKMGTEEAAALSYQKASKLNTAAIPSNKAHWNHESPPARY